MRGQILRGVSIPTLTITFSRVIRVSTGAYVSFAQSIEQSAMVSRHCRGRGHGRDFEGRGRGSVRGGRGSYGGRQNTLRKDLINVDIVYAVITSPKSAERI